MKTLFLKDILENTQFHPEYKRNIIRIISVLLFVLYHSIDSVFLSLIFIFLKSIEIYSSTQESNYLEKRS